LDKQLQHLKAKAAAAAAGDAADATTGKDEHLQKVGASGWTLI
jgi:hypothetical protein